MRHVTEYAPAKTGRYSPLFETTRVLKNISVKDNKQNGLHLARRYVQIILSRLEHYLFFKAHSFPRATLSENCSLLGIDDVR